ncbi:MAG: FixH family protein [Methylocystis sp.]|uniref:FixH family protein n=1 Tax=Methylocystis sp. TaxID=1911079 RepID=UPI0039341803
MTLMKKKNRQLAAGALLALLAFGVGHARAAIDDYAFELVQSALKTGPGVIDVRLIHKPDGKLVSDAIIFAMRLDMAPDDMEAMSSAIESTKAPRPGLYRFKVDLTDEGRWRISLAAKLQGEVGTLQNRLVVRVAR